MRKNDYNWRPVVDYEGLYIVSRNGVVMRQCANGEWVEKKASIGNTGYLRVSLYKNGKAKTVNVHQLVLASFLQDGRAKGLVCNHKNGIKTDNRIENLEWVTYKENARHAVDTGLYKYEFKGDTHYNSKLSSEIVLSIRDEYGSGKLPTSKLAQKYGVSASTICDIIKRRTWAHI